MSRSTPACFRTLLCLAALMAMLHASNLRAERIDVPLNVDLAHLQRQLAVKLELDSAGRGHIIADACNRLDLGGLELTSSPQALVLEMELTAHTGLELFGYCSGPAPFPGRLKVSLVPRAASDGRALLFQASATEVQGRNGSEGLLARASRTLAERLLLPQLDSLRVDLGASMDALDQLIESLGTVPPSNDSILAEPTRVLGVELVPDGLRAALRFSLHPLPALHSKGTSDTATALDAQELLRWQIIEDEFDGFVTNIVIRLASQLEQRDLQLELLAVLLDARHRISEALLETDTRPDPVRELFLSTWTQLRPLLKQLESQDIGDDIDLRLAGFVAAGDLLTALDTLGPHFGLEITREGLRRLARVLMQEQAPSSFTPLPLLPDAQLRALFGSPAQRRPESTPQQASGGGLWSWLMPAAHASSTDPAAALRGLIPATTALESYLDLVARLLEQLLTAHYQGPSRIPIEHQDLFDPMLRATAWKESCWRHYVGTPESPEVIRSPGGALGMMQINPRVWRGIYELDSLKADVAYNAQAGMEILEHYLVDYALRRGEHLHPGGRDNLVRASYAAYNGGPSHLARYRNPDTSPRLQAIDQAYWHDYQQMQSDRWPTQQRCFAAP